MSTDELTRRLRASGRFVFTYRISDEDKELPEAHLKARLKINFQRCLESYFGEAHTEPIAKYPGEPERY